MKRIVPLLALLIALPASAEVFKCRKPDGGIEIANSPCRGGSTTVKAEPDETVPEASRREAERNNERLGDYADKLEASRKADEATQRKELQRQQQAANQAASRAQPTPPPAPHYYGVPVYVQPRPKPRALPAPGEPPGADKPVKPVKPGTPAPAYQAPNNYRAK